ncbi:MAG: DinB family protein [Stappiaceae bacterium]
MLDLQIYQTLAEYNHWMTEKLYAAADSVPDSVRKEDRGAFFRSIHSTFNHILMGDIAWMQRFTERPYPIAVKGMGVDIFEDYAALQSAHLDMALYIKDWSQTLKSEWLSGQLHWESLADNVPRERPCWLCVSHLFNHQTHHRGQITTLLKQLDVDVGDTDLPFMPGL